MITLSGVSKSYSKDARRPALAEVSLTINPGEMVAVLGPNGAGKSTLLGMLSGIIPPTTGTIEGRPVCSVVLQQTSLDKLLTIRENALVFARVYGVAKHQREQRLQLFAETTGLRDRLDDRVGTLSGGLARRADLLRAVMVGPELLLLDEPTAGLDRSAAPEIMSQLKSFRDTHQMAVVVVTHSMDEAEDADRVLILNEGRVVVDDSPEHLLLPYSNNVVLRTEASLGTYERLADTRFLVPRTDIEQVTSELVAQNTAYSVRSVSIADVYDRVIGSAP